MKEPCYDYEQIVWFNTGKISGQTSTKSTHPINSTDEFEKMTRIVKERLLSDKGIDTSSLVVMRFEEFHVKKGFWHRLFRHSEWERIYHITFTCYLIFVAVWITLTFIV